VGERRSVDGLLEIIREDLNNYGECMIPIGKATSFLLLQQLVSPLWMEVEHLT
jgi:hypothetical protein